MLDLVAVKDQTYAIASVLKKACNADMYESGFDIDDEEANYETWLRIYQMKEAENETYKEL